MRSNAIHSEGPPCLVFVYNADSTFAARAFDMAHKIVSPQTYACRLCSLTYGAFREKEEWSEFLRTLPVTAIFLHRDEFSRQYPSLAASKWPAVLLKASNGTLSPFIDSVELSRAASLTDFQALLVARLQAIGSGTRPAKAH